MGYTRITVTLAGRALELRLTAAAATALRAPGEQLTIELELYFSCLLRKRVHFLAEPHSGSADCVTLSDRARLCFRPVMTRACRTDDLAGEPDTESFPLVRTAAFVPRWVALDFRRGAWSGDFGY
jgi:hypothetical protein